MHYFSEVPEGQAIVQSGGVYRQVPIYTRTDPTTGSARLYARFGGGYVRLAQGGTTSKPKVLWVEIDPGDGSYSEKGGAVTFTPGQEAPEKVAAQ